MASMFVWHSLGWKSCTFSFVPDYVAKTQNPSILDPRFEELMTPFLGSFVDGARDKLLLRNIRVLKKYLSRTEQ